MIKSQDELNPCNDGKRSSEVLIKTIEKCEKLQKQLDKAIECLKCCREELFSHYDSGAEAMANAVDNLLNELGQEK